MLPSLIASSSAASAHAAMQHFFAIAAVMLCLSAYLLLATR